MEKTQPMEQLIGQTLDGKYWLENQLGKGGMGTVYLATHIHTRRHVAVKVIASVLAGSIDPGTDRARIEHCLDLAMEIRMRASCAGTDGVR